MQCLACHRPIRKVASYCFRCNKRIKAKKTYLEQSNLGRYIIKTVWDSVPANTLRGRA